MDVHADGMPGSHNTTIKALNALLRGELAAVEVYGKALAHGRSHFEAHSDDLEECLASHRERVQFLIAEILRRGGKPIASSGLRGRLAGLLERVAKALSFKWGTRVLQAGENRGIRIYDEAWRALDNSARRWVSEDLFPQQVLTYQSMFLLTEELSRVDPKAEPRDTETGAQLQRFSGGVFEEPNRPPSENRVGT